MGCSLPGGNSKISAHLSIDHTATSPYYPRFNGQAERFVDSFKRALRKSPSLDTGEEHSKIYWCTESLQTQTQFQVCHKPNWWLQGEFLLFGKLLLGPTKKNLKKKTLRTNFSNVEIKFSSKTIEMERISEKMEQLQEYLAE